MKVDKGVCTTNDAYFAGNNTTNELSSIIKFETVFTTLVENKILAIKRECEQHESKKKSRTLKSLLLRKSNDESGGNFFLRKYRKKPTDVDIEKAASTVNDDNNANDELVNVVVVPQAQSNDDTVEVKLDSQSNVLVVEEATDADAKSSPAFSSANLHAEKQNCDKLIISHTDNAQVPLSTNISSIVRSRKETTPVPNENDESLDTTVDISLQSHSAVHHNKALANVNIITANNDKSDVAICDDGASSQNTSDIEFSLVSENSINELPATNVLHRKQRTSTNSDPIIKAKQATVARDKKQTSERKAKSCQSTPICGRAHQHVRSESEGKKVLTFQKEPPKTKAVDTVKSQTIVIAPTSTTTTTTLAKPITTVSGPLESVHKKALQSRHSKHRDVSIEYEITYDNEDGTQSPHGFISSFNQLTSQKQPAAIISANLKKQPSKGHTTKEGKSQLDVEEADDKKTAKHHEIELELDELGIDAVNKRRKRRRQSSKCSEYTSTATGLKHCILSRPPNQPIQIDYDSGYMFDVSLQIESEFNGEIKSIVPEHKRHRRKHHHDHERCRQKRKKKRKILVHNLDDKSLKVIDPDSDELPQRAKFTIVATACLLLIMCLLLVGVTLRMAPLIDDMVRQENERLLQESLNRAKMAVNFTDPPSLAAATTTTSLPTMKMLHQHPNLVP